MQKVTIKEIREKYDLELDKIVNDIKESKAQLVLLQFADGLKPYSTIIVDYLKEKINQKTEFLIWLGSCYGVCDVPVLGKDIEKKVDLVVQFGHSELQPPN